MNPREQEDNDALFLGWFHGEDRLSKCTWNNGDPAIIHPSQCTNFEQATPSTRCSDGLNVRLKGVALGAVRHLPIPNGTVGVSMFKEVLHHLSTQLQMMQD